MTALERGELEALLYLQNTWSGPPNLLPIIAASGSARAAWRTARQQVAKERLRHAERHVTRGLETLEALGVEIITWRDSRYPERLRHLEQEAPYVLFARGRLELLKGTSLGVVGSRRCTEYGLSCTRSLIMPLARAGAVIVSGMALGIDSAAHAAALEAGGKTIAVLGSGIDICYPRQHAFLYETMARDGLLLSEFAPGSPPRNYHFPHRNRILAFLSQVVLVVEAARLSGSLITARKAMAHMHVMAVPGPLGRPTSEGCNDLIREGAELVTCAEDLLTTLKLKPAPESEGEVPLELVGPARDVWRVLSNQAMHTDEVALQARLPVPAVAHLLLELELAGHVCQLPGSRFARRSNL